MADVRALLKAKRQEARVNHPLASYSSDNVLRCIICSTAIKHASAWQGHLGSKAHRVNVTQLKQEEEERERRRLEEEEKEKMMEIEREVQQKVAGEKRKMTEDEPAMTKKQRMDVDESMSTTQSNLRQLPVGFFSDPSRAAALPTEEDEDDDEDAANNATTSATTNGNDIDAEYLAFQKAVIEAPDYQEVYQNATILAEPELAPEVPEGFPSQANDQPVVQEEQPLSEEELRKRKELEERELIMDRLLEEERAQEDADMKVIAMKAKLEAFKQRRQKKAKNVQQ